MSLLINLIVGILVVWLVYAFLIPLLPYPFGTVALVLLVIAVILWIAGWRFPVR